MQLAHIGNMMDPKNGDGHMQWGMMLMGLLWLVIGLLLLTTLVLGIVALLRYISKSTNKAALDTLKARYSKGEISREDFNQIKKDLGSNK